MRGTICQSILWRRASRSTAATPGALRCSLRNFQAVSRRASGVVKRRAEGGEARSLEADEVALRTLTSRSFSSRSFSSPGADLADLTDMAGVGCVGRPGMRRAARAVVRADRRPRAQTVQGEARRDDEET